jgi:hypothetical protein
VATDRLYSFVPLGTDRQTTNASHFSSLFTSHTSLSSNEDVTEILVVVIVVVEVEVVVAVVLI